MKMLVILSKHCFELFIYFNLNLQLLRDYRYVTFELH